MPLCVRLSPELDIVADMIPVHAITFQWGKYDTNYPSRRAKSKAWIWLVVLKPILTVIRIITGSAKAGGMCGSVFGPDSLAAELYDTMGGHGGAAECRLNIASMAVQTWTLIVLGIVLVLTGIIVRSIINNRGAAVIQQAPSVAAQIEDLFRLTEQRLIDEEFNTKRVELLSRLKTKDPNEVAPGRQILQLAPSSTIST